MRVSSWQFLFMGSSPRSWRKYFRTRRHACLGLHFLTNEISIMIICVADIFTLKCLFDFSQLSPQELLHLRDGIFHACHLTFHFHGILHSSHRKLYVRHRTFPLLLLNVHFLCKEHSILSQNQYSKPVRGGSFPIEQYRRDIHVPVGYE